MVKTARNIITAEEISQINESNAYDVIRNLRPHLLNYRGVRGKNVMIKPVVYLNNVKYGDIQSLYNIPAMNIKEIKFLSPTDATTLFGIGHMGGAFVVTTK